VLYHWGFLEEANSWFVTDKFLGKIRTLYDNEQVIQKAWPGDPVSITGFKDDELPPSGSGFFVLPKEEAERVHEFRKLLMEYKIKEMQGALFLPNTDEDLEKEQDTNDESISEGIQVKWSRILKIEDQEALSIIVKSDNVGRLETILGLLETLAEEENLNFNVIVYGVGDVTCTDLEHARIEVEENKANLMPIYLFGESIKVEANAAKWLAKHGSNLSQIRVKHYQIIYDIIKDIRLAIQSFLRPTKDHKKRSKNKRFKK